MKIKSYDMVDIADYRGEVCKAREVEKEFKRLKKALFVALSRMAMFQYYWNSLLEVDEILKDNPNKKFVDRYRVKHEISFNACKKLRKLSKLMEQNK